jgi:multisubunit Na+/H+ antiporter MnhF subunit
MITAFVLAAIGMLVATVPCLIVVWRGEVMESVVAYEAIGGIAVMVLLLLAEGFQRSGEFELAVLLAVLILGSGLVFARFFERWL